MSQACPQQKINKEGDKQTMASTRRVTSRQRGDATLSDLLLLAWGFDTGGVRPRAGKWNAGFGATMWHGEVHLGR